MRTHYTLDRGIIAVDGKAICSIGRGVWGDEPDVPTHAEVDALVKLTVAALNYYVETIGALEEAGYEVLPDPDQPGKFVWRNAPDNTGCDVSLDTEALAWADAIRWETAVVL